MNGKTRRQQLLDLLAENPDDSFVRYGLAMEHVSAGEDEEALSCLRALLAEDPGYVPAYMQAGQVLVRLHRRDEARAVWQQGVTAAQAQGDRHAADEMQRFLLTLA